jgi:hypothetical protein
MLQWLPLSDLSSCLSWVPQCHVYRQVSCPQRHHKPAHIQPQVMSASTIPLAHTKVETSCTATHSVAWMMQSPRTLGDENRIHHHSPCAICQLGKQEHTPKEESVLVKDADMVLKKAKLEPGDLVFSNQYKSPLLGPELSLLRCFVAGPSFAMLPAQSLLLFLKLVSQGLKVSKPISFLKVKLPPQAFFSEPYNSVCISKEFADELASHQSQDPGLLQVFVQRSCQCSSLGMPLSCLATLAPGWRMETKY